MPVSWWKKAVFYEVYMPSFADGNGDGFGDFHGLTEKLGYLVELGVDVLWLTPFYPSPKVDNGYDISDYCQVDPDFGTLEDFARFIEKAKDLGLKVVIDLVLNHTSSEHKWFKEALSSPDHPKRDWYIWKDPVNEGPPNNWESFFGGSAWELDPSSGQYYYHAFAKEQVDLNWTNPEVVLAMKNVMTFWLDRGVDGFRLDVINFLKTNGEFPDNPWDDEGNEQDHLYDKDQEGILEVIQDLAAFVHQQPDKVLIGEVGSDAIDVLKRYSGAGLLDVVFNFNIGSLPTITPEKVTRQLRETYEAYKDDQYPTLFFSSHDMPRMIGRLSSDRDEDQARLMAVLQLTLKGVPFIYYGDELGINNYKMNSFDDIRDIQGRQAFAAAVKRGLSPDSALEIAREKSRDASRTPMPWGDGSTGEFSAENAWLPFSEGTPTVVNQAQNDTSMLHFYKKLLALRKNHAALHSGDIGQLQEKDGLTSYNKSFGTEIYRIALNFNDAIWDIPWKYPGRLLWSSDPSEKKTDQLEPFEARIYVDEKEHDQ